MHSRPEDIVYQDMLWNIVGVLAVVAVAALAMLAVVAKAEPSKRQATAPGMLTIYASWPAASCSDVDVWIGDPVDDKPVSYGHKHGELVDLLRDDMGCTLDRSGQNFEMATSHGIEPGEYVVNVGLYRMREAGPIVVHVTCSIINGDERTEIKELDVTLEAEGEEQTAVAFRLDSDGKLVPGSVNTIPQPLWRKG